jgi:nucleotide-binding universal stress UspA family protein
MTTAFNKILIPVDFSVNTEIAIKKALAFIERQRAEIHLVHVVRRKDRPAAKFIQWEAEKKLDHWKAFIEETTNEITVHFTVLRGWSVEQMIIEAAAMFSPGLIIIGKRDKKLLWPFHPSISPDHIARKSHCPVLTVKLGAMDSRTKVIVLPIRDKVPERKIKLAILIARRCRAQVHLLVIGENDKSAEGQPQPFISAYHHIRENLHQPVEYHPISRHNTARATLHYAESVMADMILLHPETESGISTLTGSRHISDWIRNDSKIQVLDIEP